MRARGRSRPPGLTPCGAAAPSALPAGSSHCRCRGARCDNCPNLLPVQAVARLQARPMQTAREVGEEESGDVPVEVPHLGACVAASRGLARLAARRGRQGTCRRQGVPTSRPPQTAGGPAGEGIRNRPAAPSTRCAACPRALARDSVWADAPSAPKPSPPLCEDSGASKPFGRAFAVLLDALGPEARTPAHGSRLPRLA